MVNGHEPASPTDFRPTFGDDLQLNEGRPDSHLHRLAGRIVKLFAVLLKMLIKFNCTVDFSRLTSKSQHHRQGK